MNCDALVFNLVKDAPPRELAKLDAIILLRDFTGISLRQAKQIVDDNPDAIQTHNFCALVKRVQSHFAKEAA